ncbi:hypothetical protein GINT2_001638 [Glugoides intestinalis]
METMVSSSNNTQKVIYLWQDLVWSIQPEGLLSTKSFTRISIVVFFIMILRNGIMYYNNLLSFKMTILLTIISGIIFGKGVEILFRTLHIIWSGAYGNVVFSLDDIFISLLFGSIFVSFGYCLLFNKKLHEWLRLFVDADKGPETEAELEEMMASAKATMTNDKAPIVNRLEAMRNYLKLKIRYGTEEEGSKLHEIYIKINETLPKLEKIGFENYKTRNYLKIIIDYSKSGVKAELEEKNKNNVKLTSNLSEKLISSELNEDEIDVELDAILTGFQEYNKILTEFKTAKEAELEVIMRNNEASMVNKLEAMRNYLSLKMVGKSEKTVSKLKEILSELYKTLPEIYEIHRKSFEIIRHFKVIIDNLESDVKAELEEKDKSIKELTSNLSEKLISYELNEDEVKAIIAGFKAILTGFQEYNKILTEFKTAKESELKEIMADDQTLIVDILIAMLDYLELTMVGKPKETVSKLKNVCIKINETVSKLEKIGIEIGKTMDSLNKMKPGMNPDVKAELEEKVESIGDLFSKLNQKLISSKLNEAGPEEIETELQAIEAGLDKIVAGFKEYKEILTKEKAAELAAAKKPR